jgi:hypothetical protein
LNKSKLEKIHNVKGDVGNFEKTFLSNFQFNF